MHMDDSFNRLGGGVLGELYTKAFVSIGAAGCKEALDSNVATIINMNTALNYCLYEYFFISTSADLRTYLNVSSLIRGLRFNVFASDRNRKPNLEKAMPVTCDRYSTLSDLSVPVFWGHRNY